MAANAQAIGYLDLNIKGFQEAIATAQKALAGLAVAFAGVKTVDFLKDGTKNAIEFGNQAYLAAQKLNGYDPGKLLIAQKALEQSGLSAEEAKGRLEEFAQAGRPLDQLFKGGQAGFSEAATRAAKEYGTQAAVLSESADKFAFVQKQLDNVGTKLQGFFLGLADKIATPLSNLIAQIDQVDLVSMGEVFGQHIKDAVDVIMGLVKNHDLFSSLALALQVGFMEAVNSLAGGLNAAVSILTNADLWIGVVRIAIGSFAKLGSFLVQMISGIGKMLEAVIQAAIAHLIPLLSKIPGIGASIAKSGANLSTDVSANFKNINAEKGNQNEQKVLDLISNIGQQSVGSGVSEVSKAIAASFKDFKAGTVFDTTALTKKLADSLISAQKTGAPLDKQNGSPTPAYSGTNDRIGVIADSLAKVGGGGRYMRTGLSISEKAQLDAVRYAQQSLEVQKSIAKNTAKNKPTTMSGG